MNPTRAKTARSLLRDLLVMQLKLLAEAARDLALSPVLLAAAALDLLLSRLRPPRYFHALMRWAERSDQWIDLWSAAREPHETEHANIDQLLLKIEQIVQDPHNGARRARVLRRWVERRVLRAARQAKAAAAKPASSSPPPPSPADTDRPAH